MAPKKSRPRWAGTQEELVDSLRDMAYKYRHKTPCFPSPGKTDKETLVKHCATMHALLKLQPTLSFKRSCMKQAWQTLMSEVAQWQDKEWVTAGTEACLRMCRSLGQKMIHNDARSPFMKLMGLTPDADKIAIPVPSDHSDDEQQGAVAKKSQVDDEQKGAVAKKSQVDDERAVAKKSQVDDEEASDTQALATLKHAKPEDLTKLQAMLKRVKPNEEKQAGGEATKKEKLMPQCYDPHQTELAQFDWELQKAYRYTPQGARVYAEIHCPEDCSSYAMSMFMHHMHANAYHCKWPRQRSKTVLGHHMHVYNLDLHHHASGCVGLTKCTDIQMTSSQKSHHCLLDLLGSQDAQMYDAVQAKFDDGLMLDVVGLAKGDFLEMQGILGCKRSQQQPKAKKKVKAKAQPVYRVTTRSDARSPDACCKSLCLHTNPRGKFVIHTSHKRSLSSHSLDC